MRQHPVFLCFFFFFCGGFALELQAGCSRLHENAKGSSLVEVELRPVECKEAVCGVGRRLEVELRHS